MIRTNSICLLRKNIGVQIPGRLEMMRPNENYLFFPKGDESMKNKEKKRSGTTRRSGKYGMMLQDFFDQLFFEFQMQSRKRLNQISSNTRGSG